MKDQLLIDAEKTTPKYVHCICRPDDNVVDIYKGEVRVGYMNEVDNEPTVYIITYGFNQIVLKVTDLDIIMENWNMMKEMRQRRELNPLDRFRFWEEKNP